ARRSVRPVAVPTIGKPGSRTGGLTGRPNVAALKPAVRTPQGFESLTLRHSRHSPGAPSGPQCRTRGGGPEAQTGVPVAPPASADLRGVPALAAVSTSAVADPDGGSAGVVAPVRLA